MDLDDIKRGLRAEIKKRENEQYLTFQCNVRQMCKDVLAKLEEQDAEIESLKAKLETVNELVKTSKDLYDHAVESLEKSGNFTTNGISVGWNLPRNSRRRSDEKD